MRKSTFFIGQPVFSQLLHMIPSAILAEVIKKHRSDRYCKYFKSQDHLVSMLYQGFFQCSSLRELITGMLAQDARLRHLGLQHSPRRSTLSDANKRRPAAFFEDLFHALYRYYFTRFPDSSSAGRLFIIDSTTITLFTSIMKGAGSYARNGRKKGGVKAHVLLDAQHNIPALVRITEAREHDLTFLKHLDLPAGSIVVFDKAYTNHTVFNTWNEQTPKTIWVTRQKNDSVFEVTKDIPVQEQSLRCGVKRVQLVVLGRPSNQQKTPLVKARRVEYIDPESGKFFSFITNDEEMAPEQIADIYRQRWQIELLFKRIKQRYPLRYFLGDNENAIRIQIWCMLICDLLVQVVRTQMSNKGKNWSYANLAALLKHHLMTYIDLWKFLANPEKALLGKKDIPPQTGTLF